MGDRWAGQPAADVSLNHALSLDVCNTQNETRDTTQALLHEYPVGVGSRVVGRLWS